MAQPQTLQVHIDVDIAPVRAKLRRILSLAREVNQELAHLDEQSVRQVEYITELREQLAQYRIQVQLEEEQ